MKNADDTTVLAAIAAAVGAVLLGGGWLSWWLAGRFSGTQSPPGGPLAATKALIKGEAAWPTAATWWALGLVVVVTAVAVLVALRFPGRSVDRAAARLPRAGQSRYRNGTGPVIGRKITGGMGRGPLLRMTHEDQAVMVAGPRTGKTTSMAIPATVAHTGPVLVTSNKRDIYDAIHPARSETGRVWLFDPQGLASEASPTWWWDPLVTARTVRGARRLAAIWAEASREPGSRPDAYFDPEGTELLAALLMAAAVGHQPISAVYGWLGAPDNPEPLDLLSEAAGAELIAQGLAARQGLPDKQRAGVYGTAAKVVAWLADPEMRVWIERRTGVEAFDAAAFATSTDTLVSLSREGEGSAAPLVTALTAAVLEAAERHASTQPGGRLATPMLGMLDEAANVCRWRELPDLYSHYGSRGILLVSIFQSWAQMAEAFGKDGAEKLWSAANVRIYGGGVTDTDFLRRLSQLAGEYDATQWSHSSSRHGPSRSRSTQQRSIYEISTLAAMPPGRALVVLSAATPALVELIPWWSGPNRRRINTQPPQPALSGGTP